jgi:lipopolysaccharide export system permease protein
MPTLWRYLIHSFLRSLLLTIGAFVSILIVSRFKEIAKFAALSSDLGKTGLFIVYHVPTILPMALPISALIASYLLFHRLSQSYELSSIRASGFSLFDVASPLLLFSAFLSLLNFAFSAHLAPLCRREAKAMTYRETTGNPLLLLQRQQLVNIKQAYFDMSVVEEGRKARDVTLIAYNESTGRLTLLSAETLEVEGDRFTGNHVALLSHIPSSEPFDSLLIENQSWMSTATPLLSEMLKKNRPRLDVASMSLSMLRIRCQEDKKMGAHALVEILRRTSLSFAVFSFTLLAISFSISQTRNPSKRPLFYMIGLSLTVLIAYLLGKAFKGSPLQATLAFLAPHPLIWLFSLIRLRRISRGLE